MGFVTSLKTTIRLKIALLLVIVVTGILSLFEMYHFSIDQKAALDNLDALSERIATRLSENVRSPMWILDEERIRQIIDTEMLDSNIYAVIVEAGGVVMKGRQRNLSWNIVDVNGGISGDLVIRTIDVVRHQEKIGNVTVYITKAFMQTQQTNKLLYALFEALFVGVMLILSMAIVLNRTVLNPINKILNSVKKIAVGDYSHDIKLIQHDELGVLGDGINHMKQRLSHREAERDKALKQLEQKSNELVEFNAELEDKVEKRTSQLQQAKDSAEAANYAKSVFLANMSHELRTPLNAVLGFTQVMSDDPQVTEAQKDNLSIINRSGVHLLTLINDVLEMSKIEAGRITIEANAFDLSEMLQDILDMMSNRAEEKHLQLLLESFSKYPRYIRADAPKIRQVIINLLSNAVKFTKEGVVNLRLGAEPINGEEQFRLLCEVEDTGVGISNDDQQLIFKPFEQVGQGDDRTGTGLGLSITKKFVDMMGGELTVESELGKGTIFRASFIVNKASEHEIEETLPSRGRVIGLVPNQPDYRILVVEDNPENQELLEEILTSVGFNVRIANNGEEGVELFTQWHPHLIWMDRRMPIMDGLEATRNIRMLDHGKDVKIVALTASVFKEQVDELISIGLDDYVRKPFRIEEIYDSLAKNLGVRYLYEAEVERDNRPESDLDDLKQRINDLPLAILERLRIALIELDVEKSLTVIARIDKENSDIADELSRLVGMLDFKTLQQILGD